MSDKADEGIPLAESNDADRTIQALRDLANQIENGRADVESITIDNSWRRHTVLNTRVLRGKSVTVEVNYDDD